MTKRIWHKGPPPHIGWWNASCTDNPSTWRWWNGRRWSIAAPYNLPPEILNEWVKCKVQRDFHEIAWTDYWPKNARVPRIKP